MAGTLNEESIRQSICDTHALRFRPLWCIVGFDEKKRRRKGHTLDAGNGNDRKDGIQMKRAVRNETLENIERSVFGNIRKEEGRELSLKAATWNEDSIKGGNHRNHSFQETLVDERK